MTLPKIWQFPLQALRELLLNAVVHKDYSNPTDVIIKIFDKSIEVSNPGRLLNVSLDNLNLPGGINLSLYGQLKNEELYGTYQQSWYGDIIFYVDKQIKEYCFTKQC